MTNRSLGGLLLVGAACIFGLLLSFRFDRAPTASTLLGATDPHSIETETALQTFFGNSREPKLENLETAADLRAGAKLWATKCMHCHGRSGLADTSTAAMLRPRPRSFSHGVVKFQSSGPKGPATRADLERTIRSGIPSTSMAGFFAFPDSAIREITAYTRWLLIRNQVKTEVLAKHQEDPSLDLAAATEQASERISQAWSEASSHPVPILRDPSPASIARGAALFGSEKATCFSCHGKRGGGKGPAAWDPVNERWLLQDLWGEEVRPRNLKDTLLGGTAAADVWRRIAFGIPGTPMPAHLEHLTPEEIEALVHFVLSLQRSP